MCWCDYREAGKGALGVCLFFLPYFLITMGWQAFLLTIRCRNFISLARFLLLFLFLYLCGGGACMTGMHSISQRKDMITIRIIAGNEFNIFL